VLAVTIPVAVTVLALVSLGAVLLFRKKSNKLSVQPQASSVVVHPRDGYDPDKLVKIVWERLFDTSDMVVHTCNL
jgi:hypothetical protein